MGDFDPSVTKNGPVGANYEALFSIAESSVLEDDVFRRHAV